MQRESRESDKKRYQTIYARLEGSVAAPTAGLHFTKTVLDKLRSKNISSTEVTLHVGAGTFKPVSSDDVREHTMHTEQILVKRSTILQLVKHLDTPVIVVGTTTMRTIESLYWHGVKLLVDSIDDPTINILQWDPYQEKYNRGVSVETALNKILDVMILNELEVISGQTQLIITPGYKFKIPNILITNFHMPKSTLLLLVYAFIGKSWKDAYTYAMENDFRFLSYGDSCLFFHNTHP